MTSTSDKPRTVPASAAPEAEDVRAAAARAKDAQPRLARLTSLEKNALLVSMADALEADADAILAANAEDVARAHEDGMKTSLIDRLRLDPARLATIASQVRDTAALPDPVGKVRRGSTLANGLRLQEVTVAFGVIGMIYEARPNVTVDAAALSLKAGSAVILRGGSAAAASNTALIATLRQALTAAGLPEDLVVGIDEYGRAGVDALLGARGLVDLVIPRGGAGLIQHVVGTATVPVIETGTGNCHIYVDETADLDVARAIILNAKLQKVGACNAVETVLVAAGAAPALLPGLAEDLAAHDVVLHADPRARELIGDRTGAHVEDATEEDWGTEYLSLDLAVRVVDTLDDAVAHIRRYSTGHTETILTNDLARSRVFQTSVDAAVINVNASPRYSDGGEFGFGAEIGISTQKLHARGPMGLDEIVTTSWLVVGDGHVRP